MGRSSIPAGKWQADVVSGPPHSFGYLLIETFEDGSAIWEAPDGARCHLPDKSVLYRYRPDNTFHFKEPG